MAQEQTALVGEAISVLVNVIDSQGAHVAANINTTTTRIEGFPATAPTVTTVNTGIYRIVFSGVSPAPSEGDRLIVKVNGDIAGTAWTEYAIPVKILANDVSTFDEAADQVIVSANNDKTGYSISGTKQTLDALNDIDASAVVSGGAITTSGGSVSTVTTVANMRGTDNALLAASAPANFGTLGINGSGHISQVTVVDTLTANGDKTGYSLSAAGNTATADALLDHVLGKGTAGTVQRALWQQLKVSALVDGEVSGTPTNSAFDSNLTAVTGAFDHLLVVFTSGSLQGEARPVLTYNSTNGRIVLQEGLTSAPVAADEFIVVPDHSAPIAEYYQYFISGSNPDAFKADVAALATQASVNTIDANVDAVKVKTDQLTFTDPLSVDATATVSVDTAAIADAVIAGIGGTDVTISSVIAADGTTITIVRGDDYNNSDGRAITWTGTTSDQWPSLSGATLKFTALNRMDSITVVPVVTQPTGTQAFRMELSSTESNELMSGRYPYDVQATLSSGRIITLVIGELIVKKSYTDVE